MKAIKRILLPTDFSTTCEAAREHAAVIAARCGAELHLLHVQVLHAEQLSWAGATLVENYEAEITAAARSHLSKFAEPLAGKVVEALDRAVTAGPAILRYAKDHAIDLIVMGTSAHKGIARWFMGSEAATVVRDSNCPVLVVAAEQKLANDAYACILATVDFSESSETALQQAAAMAHIHGSRLVVAHVIDEFPLPPYYDIEFAEAKREHARTALNELLNKASLPVPAEPMIAVGKPHQQIGKLARECGAQLIVMGFAGMSGFERFMLGSTTDRVMRSAPCPVLAHRGDEVEPI